MFRKKMPFILAAVILLIILLDRFIPLEVKSILYAISLSIKSVIIFLLPVIIFSLLFKAMINLASSATKIIGLIFASVIISNFLSTFLSHFVGMWVYKFDLSLVLPNDIQGLVPTWVFELPPLIPNDKAMFAGLILGILASMVRPELARIVANKLEIIVMNILNIFTYMIPLFVIGFVVKLQYDGVMGIIVRDYAVIFVIIACAQFAYIALIYFLANNGKINDFITSIKNTLPAAITGFSTMSSAAAMPFTIIGAEKNSENKDLVRSIIPATVNIHLIGDCFAIPIFAYAVLKSYAIAEPSMLQYLSFAFYFVLAKFSVAAIPGGGIIVMLPILESHLGFNAQMMSLITALYILFDPVITCANVLGNGGFALVIDKLVIGLKKKNLL